jgi:O-antigen ligase
LIGTAIKGFNGALNYSALKNYRTFFLILLLSTCVVSFLFAPYSGYDEGRAIGGSWFILENLFKMILAVLVGSVLVSSVRELKVFAWMYAAIGIYLTYWINDRYLSGAAFGRVAGPSSPNTGGAYADENVFSALFVTVIPFIFYLAMTTKRKLLRYIAFGIIPLAWHAIFLTGSRGGMLALGVSSAILAVRLKSRSFGILMAVGLIVAFVWQGGSVLQSRMETLGNYEEDDSANDRVNAWKAAASMIAANPLTGVGPGAFVRAFPIYSDKRPAQAHNTLLQFAAEFGLIAGLAYIGMIVASICALWNCAKKLTQIGHDPNNLLILIDATIVAQAGIAVASVFLSLQLFEPMYFLVFFANILISAASKDIVDRKTGLTQEGPLGSVKKSFINTEVAINTAGVCAKNDCNFEYKHDKTNSSDGVRK